MKKIFLYGLAFCITCIAGASLNSCNTIDAGLDAGETVDSQPSIVLTFETVVTSRTEENDGIYKFNDNEMAMNTVDLFFYPFGTVDSEPVKAIRINNTKHERTHAVSISDDEFEALFGSSDQTRDGFCVVYAVVNVPDEDYAASGVVKSTATPDDLKKIKTNTPSFATELSFTGGLAMITKEESGDFVYYTAADKKAAGTVKLKNLAAKIDLLVNFETDVKGVNPNDDKNAGIQSWNVATNNGTPTAEVHILNGVKAVVLGGFSKEALDEEKDYYSIRYNNDYTRGVKALVSGDKDYSYGGKMWYATAAPYYSYPNEWEDNPLEQHRTTLLLKVDWTTLDDPEEAGDNNVLTTYYTVPLALDAKKLESNKYYRVKVNINTLGGQNFGEPLEIKQASVEVLDWGHAELEADIRELRYLEVSQTQRDRDGSTYTAVINGNDGLVTIPFKSSHKVVIRDINIEWYSYDNFDDNGKEGDRDWYIYYPGNRHTFDPVATTFTKTRQELESNDWHCAYIDNVNHTITVKHNIGVTSGGSGHYEPNKGTNDINTYYSYKITINLKHEDSDQKFDLETITIMHHPPIYIEGELNDVINDIDWEWNSGGNASKDRTATTNISTKYHWGWARVNGNDPTADGNRNYGGLRGIAKNDSAWGSIGDRSSKNPVMYIINVTSLEEGSVFHIRDPRVTTNQAGSIGGNWTAAPHYLNGAFNETNNAHTLTDYYPTDESKVNEMKYALSPRYRVASSFGQTATPSLSNNPKEISRDDAKRRCASYCEFGYPAGRWRLPTLGEIKYIQVLSNKGLIPRIFNVNVDYICAQGIFKFNNAGDETENVNANDAYVRCVYDDWYWVKADGTPDKIDDPYNALSNHQIFVWGDKPKNNPQVQPTETGSGN